MNCSYCSSKIFEADRFCPRCGAPATNVSHKETDPWWGASGSIEVRGGINSPLLYTYIHSGENGAGIKSLARK